MVHRLREGVVIHHHQDVILLLIPPLLTNKVGNKSLSTKLYPPCVTVICEFGLFSHTFKIDHDLLGEADE